MTLRDRFCGFSSLPRVFYHHDQTCLPLRGCWSGASPRFPTRKGQKVALLSSAD